MHTVGSARRAEDRQGQPGGSKTANCALQAVFPVWTVIPNLGRQSTNMTRLAKAH
jgi:hypothetical protein